ncbi:MAG: diguanylate cyclase [Gammaproteobacteria bacterium]|nr:diguanylate cyclase [Gammaproteobacteria bacterium]
MASSNSKSKTLKKLVSNPLGRNIATWVSLGLIIFSMFAGWFTYSLVFYAELEKSESFEKQLVQTVQIQAAVGVFANNKTIVKDVIQGLLANPNIQWVRISSNDDFIEEQGKLIENSKLSRYALYSPVDNTEIIGEIHLLSEYTLINQEAKKYAFNLAGFLIIQTLILAIVLLTFVHFKLTSPITQLSLKMSSIEAGNDVRLEVDEIHKNDEIGLLCQSANQFLETAEKAIKKANKLARTDPLTKLNNRRAFFELAQSIEHQAKRYKWPYSLVLIDIDYFKKINDTYGHDIGDNVLVTIAETITVFIREVDIAARMGGEEFMIIMPETSATAAAILADRLRIQFSGLKIQADNSSISVTASFGIVDCDAEKEGISYYSILADKALYLAKENGRNRVEVYQHDIIQP